MGLAGDVRLCMKLNRMKDFIVSPSGLFLIGAAITIFLLVRHGLKESK